MALKLDAESRELVKEAVTQGMRIARSKNHLILKHPDGRQMTLSLTPSDRRAHERRLSEFRKLGFSYRGRGYGGTAVEEAPVVKMNQASAPVSASVLTALADGQPKSVAEIAEFLRPRWDQEQIRDSLSFLSRKGTVTRVNHGVYKISSMLVPPTAPPVHISAPSSNGSYGRGIHNGTKQAVLDFMVGRGPMRRVDIAKAVVRKTGGSPVGAEVAVYALVNAGRLVKVDPTSRYSKVRLANTQNGINRVIPINQPEPLAVVTASEARNGVDLTPDTPTPTPTVQPAPAAPAPIPDASQRYVDLLFARAADASGAELTELLNRIEKVVG